MQIASIWEILSNRNQEISLGGLSKFDDEMSVDASSMSHPHARKPCMWQHLADETQSQRSQIRTHVLLGRGLIFLLFQCCSTQIWLTTFGLAPNACTETSQSPRVHYARAINNPLFFLYQTRELTHLVMPHRHDRNTPSRLCAGHLSREAPCDGRSLQSP